MDGCPASCGTRLPVEIRRLNHACGKTLRTMTSNDHMQSASEDPPLRTLPIVLALPVPWICSNAAGGHRGRGQPPQNTSATPPPGFQPDRSGTGPQPRTRRPKRERQRDKALAQPFKLHDEETPRGACSRRRGLTHQSREGVALVGPHTSRTREERTRLDGSRRARHVEQTFGWQTRKKRTKNSRC